MIPSIPQLWTKQPQFPAQPRGDGLARGLVLLWNGATPLNAPVAGVPTSLNGGMSLRPFGGNLSPDFNGTSVDVRWNKALTGTNPSAATLFGLCSLDFVATERTIVGMSLAGSSTQLFRIEVNGTGFWQAQFRGLSGTANVSGGGTIAANRLYFIVGIFRSGTGVKELWVEGVQVATSTTDVGTVDLDQTEIGTLVRGGAAQWWDGVIPLAGIYNRALSTAEILSLTANPWQLFQPIQRRMFYGTTSAAGTHTTTGALSGQGASLSGTAANWTVHTTSGALSGQGSSVVGTARNWTVHTSSGSLTGPGTEVAGSAAHTAPGTHTTSGTLAGQGAAIAGSAAHVGFHATSGVLIGPGATIVGYATGAQLLVIDTHDGFAHDDKWRKPLVEREALRAQIIRAVRGPEAEEVKEIIAPYIVERATRRGKAIALEKRIDFASLYEDLEAIERFQTLMERNQEDELIVSMLLQ